MGRIFASGLAFLTFVVVPQVVVGFLALMHAGTDSYVTTHAAGPNVFDWHWLPVVLIPEGVVLLGSVFCWVSRRRLRLDARKGVAVVLIVSFISIFAVVLLAPTEGYVHGLPYPRGANPHHTFVQPG